MNEIAYNLSGDLHTWLNYAVLQLNMSTNEAAVMWHNKHSIGKYLICESREDNSTRLFIRNVTNTVVDSYKKNGWWNTFTVTKNPTATGLWLTKVVKYRLDRKGFLNLEVEVIMPVDDIKFLSLFTPENGTWNSIAWWLMMVRSEAFLEEYKFEMYSHHEPNYEALIDYLPELKGLNENEIGKVVLHKYLCNEIALDDIEACLNKPTKWEEFVRDIQKAVANGTIAKLYEEKYPVFAKKVSQNVIDDYRVDRTSVEYYLNRQLYYYEELLVKGEVEDIGDSWLDRIEVALEYRKHLKDMEKADKKRRRKNKGI